MSSDVLDDADFKQRSVAFIMQIQVKIAKKSVKGAKQLLESPYAKHLIQDQTRVWLLEKIKQAEVKARESFQKRIYWEWWVIFLITVIVGAYVISKCGVVSMIMQKLKVTALLARVVIRTAVYLITTLVGGVFGFLANAIDKLLTFVFGG